MTPGVYVFVVLEVVGFINPPPRGLGGLLFEFVKEPDGILLSPTLLAFTFGCWSTLIGLGFIVIGLFTGFWVETLDFMGIFLIVFVDVALFRELLELTKLAREFERSTLFLFEFTLA